MHPCTHTHTPYTHAHTHQADSLLPYPPLPFPFHGFDALMLSLSHNAPPPVSFFHTSSAAIHARAAAKVLVQKKGPVLWLGSCPRFSK